MIEGARRPTDGFWTALDLDLDDPINQEIWDRSPHIQEHISRSRSSKGGDVIQAALGGAPLPWVPDLVGRSWMDADAVVVVGSAYAPFIGESAGRTCTMPLRSYRTARTAAAFQQSFLSAVVQSDRNYYGPLGDLLSHTAGDASQVLLTDLVRACFVRSSDLTGGDAAIHADPALFDRYARYNWDWTWRRLRASRASVIVGLGSIAAEGLLALLLSEGCSAHLGGTSDPACSGPAAPPSKLGGWLDRGIWWEVEGQFGAHSHRWRLLPIFHPSRVNQHDPGYTRTKVLLDRMMSQTGGEMTPRKEMARPQPRKRPRPVSPTALHHTGGHVIGMHFVCRGSAHITDHGDGTFDTGYWAVATKHCDTVEYVALHERKDEPSFRQGQVLQWRTVQYQGRERVVFTVRQEGDQRAWVGDGSGEKGYAYG